LIFRVGSEHGSAVHRVERVHREVLLSEDGDAGFEAGAVGTSLTGVTQWTDDRDRPRLRLTFA
jgi:hypothetical protein